MLFVLCVPNRYLRKLKSVSSTFIEILGTGEVVVIPGVDTRGSALRFGCSIMICDAADISIAFRRVACNSGNRFLHLQSVVQISGSVQHAMY